MVAVVGMKFGWKVPLCDSLHLVEASDDFGAGKNSTVLGSWIINTEERLFVTLYYPHAVPLSKVDSNGEEYLAVHDPDFDTPDDQNGNLDRREYIILF